MSDDLILNKLIDHTLLKADATRAQIEKLCAEAREHHFATVCVNLCWVKVAAEALTGSDVKVCTVAGFPLGATTTMAKMFEAEQAIGAGATEVDMVMNIGALKSGLLDFVREDIAGVRRACQAPRKKHALLKVIIEACLLTDDEKRLVCRIAQEAGADFVKTSTGLSTGGATVADVRLMRETVGPEMGVKAAGGIRTRADAIAMIEAGATRLGTSAGVAIMTDRPVEALKPATY